MPSANLSDVVPDRRFGGAKGVKGLVSGLGRAESANLGPTRANVAS